MPWPLLPVAPFQLQIPSDAHNTKQAYEKFICHNIVEEHNKKKITKFNYARTSYHSGSGPQTSPFLDNKTKQIKI